MAKQVQAQVVGGKIQIVENCETVACVQKAMGLTGSYTATANGEPVTPDHRLREFELVQFAQTVKGGSK